MWKYNLECAQVFAIYVCKVNFEQANSNGFGINGYLILKKLLRT